MYGEPEDTPGECNARLYIGDNYGDGTATMRCQREPGHPGPHVELFDRDREEGAGAVRIEWERDESRICPKCCKRTGSGLTEDPIGQRVCLDCCIALQDNNFYAFKALSDWLYGVNIVCSIS